MQERINKAWQKIYKEGEAPPSCDYSAVADSDLRIYLEKVERKIQEIKEWPLLANEVKRRFISVLELRGFDITNSFMSAVKYKIIETSAEKGRYARYHYFDPNGARAFAAFCWPASGTNFKNNLIPNKERVAKAREALGPHPLREYLNDPAPLPMVKRSPVADKQGREPLLKLTPLTGIDPKLELRIPKIDEEEIQILNDWTKEKLAALNLAIPPNLDQVCFDNGLPFQVAQTVMFAEVIGKRGENTIKETLSKFDPNLMELTNLDLRTGVDFCLMVMNLHSTKYPTLFQLYEKARALVTEKN